MQLNVIYVITRAFTKNIMDWNMSMMSLLSASKYMVSKVAGNKKDIISLRSFTVVKFLGHLEIMTCQVWNILALIWDT